MDKHTYCVIMAGGIGSRFWPKSRQSKPKQFLDILGTGKSFIRMTYERFEKLAPAENFLVVTNARYKDLVLEQIPELGPEQVLCEPVGRNTAPCICYAAYGLQKRDPGAKMIVTPADHLILNEDDFRAIIAECLDFASEHDALMTVGINIILAVSLNVATGYLGQLPLGHAGFMAVGAYTCALFTKYSPLPSGISFAIGLVLACIMAGLFGVLIGIPALRLTGDYLAILTLGFGEIIRITLNNIDDVLGYSLFYGSKGLKNIPKYSHFSNVFLCVVITCFLIHTMMKSRHGRAVLAIRDNEIAAESCGIQTTYYKVMAFAFSAAFAGLAGGLYACYIGVLNPSTFGFMKSIEILVMVVLGGMGSMLGSILSATVLTILPEATRSFDSYRMVIYSLVLILMMIFRPGGLLGSYDFSVSRIVEKVLNGELFRKKNKEGADHE